MRRLRWLALAGLCVTGCRHWYYVKPLSDAAFPQDQYACAQQANTDVNVRRRWGGANESGQAAVNKDMFRACMLARGYTTTLVTAGDPVPQGGHVSSFDQ